MPELPGVPGESEELQGRIIRPGEQEGQVERHGEQLRTENRVVVYGTWATGAAELAGDFQTVLDQAGIPEADVVPSRYVDNIERAFFHRGPDEEAEGRKSLPRGVVVFPEMKYEMGSGSGIPGPTPVPVIRNLCEQYGVPYVLLANYNTPAEAMTTLLEEIGKQPGQREIEERRD